MCNLFHNVLWINTRAQATIKTNDIHTLLQKLLNHVWHEDNSTSLHNTWKCIGTHRTHCKRMKQALVRLPNERPECNDIKLGDCLRLLRTHRGRTITTLFPWDYLFTVLQYSLPASQWPSPNVWESLLFHPRHNLYSCSTVGRKLFQRTKTSPLHRFF